MLTLEFTSAAPEKTIEEIMLLRIPLFNILRKDELTCQIRICRTDYRKLSGILLRRGDNWRILRKQGIFWTAEALLHRPILLFLFLLLFCSSVFLPSRIFFITVDGNTAIPDKLILSAAEKCGVRFGALRKEVRSEKVKNALLSEVPQLHQGKEKLVRNMIKISNAARKVGIDQRRHIFGSILEAFGGEIKMIITGGAPVNPEILHFFESIGISVLNGYGITECAPLISVNVSRNVVRGSVGNVIDIDTVKIDEPNEDGEGEILVKGPNVMLGYYKNQEATAEAFKDGYFRTGDYGKVDKNGVLFITGRKKNLIILSNGKNVYPEEIENELVATPGVLDIIVYEGQSRRGLEHNAIVAEVYPDKDFFEKNGIEDIKAHIQAYVDEYNKSCVAYKKIAILRVRDEDFPKNTLRKIMRFKLDTTID